MTRKLLLTATIVALTLAPSIGTGTAQAYGFYGGGFGRGFHGGFGRGFTAGSVLADSFALSADWEYGNLSPEDAFPKAKAAATKALALDDRLAEAHTSLAFILDPLRDQMPGIPVMSRRVTGIQRDCALVFLLRSLPVPLVAQTWRMHCASLTSMTNQC
jgi:hypothetical protein